jgi:hypothetical protein
LICSDTTDPSNATPSPHCMNKFFSRNTCLLQNPMQCSSSEFGMHWHDTTSFTHL